MYKLMGKYGKQQAEEIDEFETREEATQMLTKYRMAYGAGWRIWIEEA